MSEPLSTSSEKDLARIYALLHPPFIHEIGHALPMPATSQPSKDTST